MVGSINVVKGVKLILVIGTLFALEGDCNICKPLRAMSIEM